MSMKDVPLTRGGGRCFAHRAPEYVLARWVFPKDHPSPAGIKNQEVVPPGCLMFAPRAPDALACSTVLLQMSKVVAHPPICIHPRRHPSASAMSTRGACGGCCCLCPNSSVWMDGWMDGSSIFCQKYEKNKNCKLDKKKWPKTLLSSFLRFIN